MQKGNPYVLKRSQDPNENCLFRPMSNITHLYGSWCACQIKKYRTVSTGVNFQAHIGYNALNESKIKYVAERTGSGHEIQAVFS